MYARGLNKALMPLGKGSVLSYMVSKFPEQEIVLAVGYKAEQVIRYASDNFKRVTCVHVSYEGEQRGPGYSLLQCAPYLQSPFIYMACDTLVEETPPPPDKNWMGIAKVEDKLPYLTVDLEYGMVNKVYDKGDESATHDASIGLVGVKDYGAFFEGLASPTFVEGEHQDTSGINALLPLEGINFTWYDTGTTEGYIYANRCFNRKILT